MSPSYVARIYTVTKVAATIAKTLTAGSIIPAVGIWHGEVEQAAILELVALDAIELERVIHQAQTIAAAEDETLLVTVSETMAALINPAGDYLPVTGSILATTR